MPGWPDNWLDAQNGYQSFVLEGIVASAANIRFGSNPPYTIADFNAMYPQFDESLFPEGVLQVFINLANSCISQERWQDSWSFGMGLYIAHFATLFLQSSVPAGASAKQVVQAGLAKAVQASKSVGDVSVSYQALTSGWEAWGQWNLTVFGQQLMSFASLIGMGGMYVY